MINHACIIVLQYQLVLAHVYLSVFDWLYSSITISLIQGFQLELSDWPRKIFRDLIGLKTNLILDFEAVWLDEDRFLFLLNFSNFSQHLFLIIILQLHIFEMISRQIKVFDYEIFQILKFC